MLSIPIPFIMPNRLTSAPYLALGNYAIYAYLICLTHVPYILNYTTLDFICQALFLQSASQLQYQPQMNLNKIIEYSSITPTQNIYNNFHIAQQLKKQ